MTEKSKSFSKRESFFGYVIAGSFVGLHIALSILLDAWAITKLWLWFVIPQFHLAPIGLKTAAGLSLLISLVTISTPYYHKEEAKKMFLRMFKTLLRPLVAIFIGWVIVR